MARNGVLTLTGWPFSVPCTRSLRTRLWQFALALVSLIALDISTGQSWAEDPHLTEGYKNTLRVFAQKPGIKIIETFDAQGGLKGVALRVNGAPMILYIDPAGENLFMGMILDAGGRSNHTGDAMARYFPGETGTEAANIAGVTPAPTPGLAPERLRGFAGIEQLKPASATSRQVFILFDLACSHCRRLYQELSSPETVTRLQSAGVGVTWLPVDFSGERTAYKAAIALGSPIPFDQLNLYFDHDWSPDITGTDIYAVVDRGAKSLAKIMQFVRTEGISAVPVIYVATGEVLKKLDGPPIAQSLMRWLDNPD